MTGSSVLGKWQKAMLVATSLVGLGAFLTAPLAEAAVLMPPAPQRVLLAQDDAAVQPTQVDEGDGDAEPLDEDSRPAASAADDDDIELLDQGSPPSSVTAAPVPVTDGTLTTAPTGTTYSVPAGPRVPPGFGEGRVFVSNSPRGVPVGLEPCEVGVVTGRAYVGIKCGEERDNAVGHASSFDDFPFVVDPGFPFEPGAAVVTDPSFPFDEDSPFYESFLDRTTDSDVVVLVAPRGFPFDDDDDESAESDVPRVITGGVVSLAQPARERKSRKRERTQVSGSATSGEVSSDPGKSRSRRSASKKQRASVESESKGKKNARSGNKKAKKNKKNKKKGNKARKDSKKQKKAEKRAKRQKNK